MECAVCSRVLADEVVVAISPHEHVAIIQPIVVAFAQYLHGWTEVGSTEPGSQDAARRFWAALSPFRDAVDTVRVVAALDALTEQAPHHVHPITD
jgi:hypothetical protein